jgi:hypothetical protein
MKQRHPHYGVRNTSSPSVFCIAIIAYIIITIILYIIRN